MTATTNCDNDGSDGCTVAAEPFVAETFNDPADFKLTTSEEECTAGTANDAMFWEFDGDDRNPETVVGAWDENCAPN